MVFIDTHTHCADEALIQDAPDVISRAAEAGVELMLQADIDSKERPAMFALVEQYPQRLRAMLGLYPGSVDKGWESEIEKVLEYKDKNIVAIGEIGLDYHFSIEFKEEQKAAFKAQLELASQMNLPVNIHLRDATDDFFHIMDECRHLPLRGNMHAYSGSFETFQRISKYGDWYVGIGGVVTFKKASLAEVVKQIPLDRILLETDAPYLTPTPHRGERNESSYIPLIAAKIAELKGVDLEEVADVTTQNARKLFNL